jgi:hypothetical protein
VRTPLYGSLEQKLSALPSASISLSSYFIFHLSVKLRNKFICHQFIMERTPPQQMDKKNSQAVLAA